MPATRSPPPGGWAWPWPRSTSPIARRPVGTARSASTAWRSWRRWPTRCCCSGGRGTCWSRPSAAGTTPPADVLAGPMLVVAIVGLVANVVAFGLLRDGSKASLNVRGAYLEVMSDLLGSLGVILAAVVLQVTGWEWVDPAVGVAIGLFILPPALRLGAHAGGILARGAPVGT